MSPGNPGAARNDAQSGDPDRDSRRRAALAVFGELEDRPRQRQRRLIPGHPRQSLTFANAVGQVRAVLLVQQWLVIVQIELARPAGHEQVDDALRLRLEVRLVEDALERGHGRATLVRQQRPERDPAEAERRLAEEESPVGGGEDGVVEHAVCRLRYASEGVVSEIVARHGLHRLHECRAASSSFW